MTNWKELFSLPRECQCGKRGTLGSPLWCEECHTFTHTIYTFNRKMGGGNGTYQRNGGLGSGPTKGE